MSNITTLNIKSQTKIVHIRDSLNEIKKTLPKENKEGELKRIKGRLNHIKKNQKKLKYKQTILNMKMK